VGQVGEIEVEVMQLKRQIKGAFKEEEGGDRGGRG